MADETVKILVSVSGVEYTVEPKLLMTVLQFKKMVAKMVNIPPEMQRFVGLGAKDDVMIRDVKKFRDTQGRVKAENKLHMSPLKKDEKAALSKLLVNGKLPEDGEGAAAEEEEISAVPKDASYEDTLMALKKEATRMVDPAQLILDFGRVLCNHPDSVKPGDKNVEVGLEKAKELIREGDELFKSYFVVQINAAGKFQERILSITDNALYRFRYDFKTQTPELAERQAWSSIQMTTYGPAVWTRMPLSLGAFLMAKDINNLYGIQILNSREGMRAGGPTLPIPFIAAGAADKIKRTFFPAMPEAVQGLDAEGQLEFMKHVTSEMAQVIGLCCRWGWRETSLEKRTAHHYMAHQGEVRVMAFHSLTSTIQNKLNIGTTNPSDRDPKEEAK